MTSEDFTLILYRTNNPPVKMSTTERFHIGQMVRTIDSNETGIIRQLNASLCEVDFDGLCITVPATSLFPYSLLDGRALTNLSQYSFQKKHQQKKAKDSRKADYL